MGLAGMAPQGMAPVQGQVTGISYPAPRGVVPGGFSPTFYSSSRLRCLSWETFKLANRALDLDS